MLRIHSISLGCPKNRVDTERALGALAALGPWRLAASPEKADLVFINTCGFIAPAVQESVRVILEAASVLAPLPENKRPLLAVAGCLVGRYGIAALAPDLPEVDLLLDARDPASWSERLAEALKSKGRLAQAPDGRGIAASSKGKNCPVQAPGGKSRHADAPASAPPDRAAAVNAAPRLLSTGPSYAWLKISDGCRHNCAFCTIPQIRGPLRSTPAEALTHEARQLLEQGVKELIVVAQDVTAWGKDTGLKHGLKSLLEKLLPLPGLARLRLMYLYPAGLTKDLLTFLKEAGQPFVPYFDVPLQHAAPPVLRAMGRPFAGKPEETVERIRAVFPDAALRTSLITGFPGESEADFALLRRFVTESRFLHLGVFAYQAEEGTAAAAMPGQIPEAEKERRREEIMALQSEISEELLEEFVGRRLDILVDAEQGEWPGLHLGRAWFQAPEIDGVTYVSGPGALPGALVEADIMESSTYDLTGLTDAIEE